MTEQKLVRFEEETKTKLEERINDIVSTVNTEVVSLSVLQTKTGFEAWMILDFPNGIGEDLVVGFE